MEEKLTGIHIQIYDYLKKINKLDSKIYSKLLSTYEEKDVNYVIEYMIDEGESLSKFSYYFNTIMVLNDSMERDVFELYGKDLDCIRTLTLDENRILGREIYEIIQEINELIRQYDSKDTKYWLIDRINDYISVCNDKEKMKKLKKLSYEFETKRNELIEGNLRLVIYIAKRYYKTSDLFVESIQEGNIGLMKAAEGFDPNFNTCFSTYAYYLIRQYIMKNMMLTENPFSISVGAARDNIEIKKAYRKLVDEYGREPSDVEIAEYLGMDITRYNTIKIIFGNNISLDESVRNSSDESNKVTYAEFIEDKSNDIEQQIISMFTSDQLLKIMDKYLDPRTAQIIKYRYGFCDDGICYTLEEVGKIVGVTRERIRQIELKGIRRLRRHVRDIGGY